MKKKLGNKNTRNIKIGDTYKHWTVIDGPKTNSSQAIIWLCECSCKENSRWIQGNELMNPNRCFKCQKCAGKDRGLQQTLDNGRIGQLTQSKFSKLQRGAKARKLLFDLTKEYLWNLFTLQKQLCAITGDFIENIKDASLDRIDSSIGYIKGNVQWTTVQANRSKHIMSTKELIEFCNKVLNHANQQPSQG